MAHVAALTAGWQRRLGGQAGPLGPVSGGSGESPNGSRLQVELLVGGTWVDITAYVMQRDGSGGISISRGQPNEASGTDPSRCTFQLNNRDGRFSPRNPASPYFGLIGRNTPLRVSVPSGNDKSYRFQGEVAQWPQRWDTTGTDVWVELEAAGDSAPAGAGHGGGRVGDVPVADVRCCRPTAGGVLADGGFGRVDVGGVGDCGDRPDVDPGHRNLRVVHRVRVLGRAAA